MRSDTWRIFIGKEAGAMNDDAMQREYRYIARKYQLIHPNPVMAYMMMLSTGQKKFLEARTMVIKKFCEPYCWENRKKVK